MIFDRTRIKGSRLGRIDLKNDCTYLNANPEDAKRILDSFHGMTPEFVLVPEEEGLPNFEAIPKRGRKFSRHRDHASGEKRPSRSFRDGFLENLHRELSGEERHHLEPHTPDRKKFPVWKRNTAQDSISAEPQAASGSMDGNSCFLRGLPMNSESWERRPDSRKTGSEHSS